MSGLSENVTCNDFTLYDLPRLEYIKAPFIPPRIKMGNSNKLATYVYTGSTVVSNLSLIQPYINLYVKSELVEGFKQAYPDMSDKIFVIED